MSACVARVDAGVDDRFAKARNVDPANDSGFVKQRRASDQMQWTFVDVTGQRGPGLDGDLRTDA